MKRPRTAVTPGAAAAAAAACTAAVAGAPAAVAAAAAAATSAAGVAGGAAAGTVAASTVVVSAALLLLACRVCLPPVRPRHPPPTPTAQQLGQLGGGCWAHGRPREQVQHHQAVECEPPSVSLSPFVPRQPPAFPCLKGPGVALPGISRACAPPRAWSLVQPGPPAYTRAHCHLR